MKQLNKDNKEQILKKIEALKNIIKEKSKQIDPNKSYSLEDFTSGAIMQCPNQKLLNEIISCEKELQRLLNENKGK